MITKATSINIIVFLSILVLIFLFRHPFLSIIIESNIIPSLSKTLEELRDPEISSSLLESTADKRLTVEGIINETNKQRTTEQLSTLRLNPRLAEAAQQKLKDMFTNQYFAHISPSGKGPSDFVTEADYGYIVVAENLAVGNFESDNEVVMSWMASPGHRANIMDRDYHEIGVAVGQGEYEGKTTWIAVQEFGTPISACDEFNESREALINSYKDQLAQWDEELKIKKARMDNLPEGSEERQTEFTAYNQLVREYNDLSRRTKNILLEYNTEATAFNDCLNSFKK